MIDPVLMLTGAAGLTGWATFVEVTPPALSAPLKIASLLLAVALAARGFTGLGL